MTDPALTDRTRAFSRWAWSVLGMNLLVIVWGAFVRASGSGAGCGAHWPTCNGDIVPHAESVETAIELTHRLTSGLALVCVVVSLLWARRIFAAGHLARRAASYAMLFMVIEALVGAALVLMRLVGDDASPARALVIGLHLVNTFLLVGALTLTATFGAAESPRLQARGGVRGLLVLGGALLALVGVAGAITALGDTLFPSETLAAGIAADLAPTAHFLVRLRVVHPVLALATVAYLLVLGSALSSRRADRKLSTPGRVLTAALVVQVAGGFLDLGLLAPTWLQLVHLFLADVVWIAYVRFAVSALAPSERAIAAPDAAAGSPA